MQIRREKNDWTQYNLKQIVGARITQHETLKKLLQIPDGKRCWTLQYADSAKFHLDILPAIVSSGYRVLMERMFSDTLNTDFEKLAIRITDNTEDNYHTETKVENWPESNPFGYGIWFEDRAQLATRKLKLMSESVQPVPKYQNEKLPLQRVVQILKRHRDMMFNGDDDKPISIIITTLVARAYKKESDIIETLLNVANTMSSFIEERYSPKHGKHIKWIANPVNSSENFADKWPDNPQKQKNFYSWLQQVQTDLINATNQQGLQRIQEALNKPFGEKMMIKTFSNYSEKARLMRESGMVKMAPKTGLLGNIGTTVKNHNFYGKEE